MCHLHDSSTSHPECGICFERAAIIKVMPCRELRMCRECYNDHRAKWQADVARVRAARKRLEDDGQPPDPKLADDPKLLCPFCRT